jgi:hypothetical protein
MLAGIVKEGPRSMRHPISRVAATPLAMLAFACITFAQGGAPAQDLAGTWKGGGRGSNRDLVLKPALKLMLPWVKAKLVTTNLDLDPSREIYAKDPDPYLQSCDPQGVPRVLLTNTPIKIVPASGEVLMFYERSHDFREVYTDGRGHPKDLDPSWWGHSIGRQDGSAFVVDTIGFNDRTWLDWSGLPHSGNEQHFEQGIVQPGTAASGK